jgi:F-type H+-transporting ATPase subunit b
LYVINDESILLLTFLGFTGLVAKYLAPAYKDFADARMKKVSDVLNASRNKHVEAVKDRIDSVSQLQNVAETTKVLFDVSKETVELESEAFELKQKVELAHEAKAVLDSWVRYEASLRQLEQRQLAKSVISRVQSELGNPKFQEKVLQQSISEIEQLLSKLK